MRYLISTVLLLIGCQTASFAKDVVVLLSVDGLRADAISSASRYLPNFNRLIKEGATTLNARTDVDVTITLPNHTSMLTSRPVQGEFGHYVRINHVDQTTVHQQHGGYVESIFDVLRKYKLTSSMIATKNKFELFERSFPIDKVFIAHEGDADAVRIFLNQIRDSDTNFYFLHLAGMDVVGHRDGWSIMSSSTYIDQLRIIDEYLGRMMKMIKLLNRGNNRVILILTADHGGVGRDHYSPLRPENYIIPMMIWGKGVAEGVNLYKINKQGRLDPEDNQIPYDASMQPIRNGEVGNLILHLFGLPCINGSSIGCQPVLNIKDS